MPSALPSAAHALPNLTQPGLASPFHAQTRLTGPYQAGAYTVAGCPVHQATSALKRPCLGRQSPMPTSLPASMAISSTSRMFSTSGSY